MILGAFVVSGVEQKLGGSAEALPHNIRRPGWVF
jgi:hypothetical protein